MENKRQRSSSARPERDIAVGWAQSHRQIEQGINLLEHVPKELLDFFDQNMLLLLEAERFLVDQMSPSDREAL